MEILQQEDLLREWSQEKNFKERGKQNMSDEEPRQRHGFMRSLASAWSHEEYESQHRGLPVYRQGSGGKLLQPNISNSFVRAAEGDYNVLVSSGVMAPVSQEQSSSEE